MPKPPINITVSDELARRLQSYEGRIDDLICLGLQQLQIHKTLLLYSRGLVSLARAAELSGLSRDDMVCQARAVGVPPLWSDALMREELA